ITIRDLAYKVAMASGRDWRTLKIVCDSNLREGDAVRRRPDISKMRELGYKPAITLDEGLRRMMQ
ncbi:MAG TPA: SDR family NAD-dependent epimerase/dehydratase, partial [Anaerolineae bacterium]|nr:SDR family NAD-dependent epimerase/dehydratase [Anaerolineae bacterium]